MVLSITTGVSSFKSGSFYYFTKRGTSHTAGDGAWTYGGLTSPAASTSSLTTSSTATSSTFTLTSSATPTSSLPSYHLHLPHLSLPPHPLPFPPLPHQITLRTQLPYLNEPSSVLSSVLSSFPSSCLCFSSGWNILTPDATGEEENRPAGLGSPRNSGDDEADSFLRRSTAGPGVPRAGATHQDSYWPFPQISRWPCSTATDPERHPRPVSSLSPGAAPPRIVRSASPDRTKFSQAPADYGVVLPGPGHFGRAYSGDGIPAHTNSEMLGRIMFPGELLRIGDEEETRRHTPITHVQLKSSLSARAHRAPTSTPTFSRATVTRQTFRPTAPYLMKRKNPSAVLLTQ
ncbi:hypothetical protein DFJ58DRAFT_875718 [Suillus subalutaceus]|uniref:uncharacterized protein n=1 Tax=Suillus subalutaceus TaxID=48586 RepID=UPI001B87C25F|nr:uncharacterized protein DFJ58DRAFT_875718 [Suillus subalutaceus]KAG1829385.1 hypothetical protein DFJ58DRAFT_875718 [Suillus subalutaceus]